MPGVERPGRRRGRTSTSLFGVSGRESHDSSAFYERFPAPELSDDSEVSTSPVRDVLVVGDSRDLSFLPDKSVGLVVTSPPYHSSKVYEEIGKAGVPTSYVEYLQMLTDVFAECVRKLEPGGRIAVNVANLGRKPFRSLAGDVTRILQDDLGLLLRGEHIWQKADGAGGNCAWGSFRSPSNPVMRDLTERIIVASKGRFDRAIKPANRAKLGLPHEATISKEEFMALTLDVWRFQPESAKRVRHPAPFPVELPRRLIELHTFRGDLVVDVFGGSCSTALAAAATGRSAICVDLERSYLETGLQRLQAADANTPFRVVEAARPGGSAANLPAPARAS